MKRIILAITVTTAACNTASEPFLLDHAQILAVRSEPAHVAAGGTVRIDALVGNDAGDIQVAVPDQVIVEGFAAERGADGWYVQSSPMLPAAPTATVAVTIDGVEWRATKQLDFGDDHANPTMAAMQVDGVATQTIATAKGAAPALDVLAGGADPGTLTYAWYTSIGTLEHYRSAEATLDAGEPGAGTVVVVVRDDAGGVAWQTIPVEIR